MALAIENCLKKKKGAKGVVLIVTNTYRECKVDGETVTSLEACYVDGKKMEETFAGTFGFACHWEQNATAEKMMQLVDQVAKCNYNDSYKDIGYIVVVFSGHGGEGTLLGDDGEEIEVNGIIERLKPTNMPNASEKMVKLFFFDACRGESMMAKAKGPVQPRPGEYLVAYSTYEGFVSFTRPDGKGSQWMPDVAESLKVEKDLSIQDAIVKVNVKRKWSQSPTIFSTGSSGFIKLHEVILGQHASAGTKDSDSSKSGKGKSGSAGGKADERPEYTDLIVAREWLGNKGIARFIAQREEDDCDNFADLLLNDKMTVGDIRRNAKNNNAFVNEVLRKWTASVGPPPKPCTWGNLIDCMKKSGLEGDVVKKIEEHVCS